MHFGKLSNHLSHHCTYGSRIWRFVKQWDTLNCGYVRRYNESTMLVKPMESIEFVVENRDDTGGVGANFVVEWAAKTGSQRPYFQGIMIGTTGQQGISFTTEGIVIQQ